MMDDYTPIKLAFYVAEPMFGVDEKLCPIIFIHGMTSSKELWHEIPQIVADETSRRAYVLDMRNHGDSQWSDTWTSKLLVQDLRHFMDTRNIQKAVLIGHSIAAYASQIFTLESPERVEMLIAEDPFIGTETKLEQESTLTHAYMWEEAVRKVPPFMCKSDAIKYAVDYFYTMVPADKKATLSEKEVLYKCDYNLKQKDDGSYEVKENIKVATDFIRGVDGKFFGLNPLVGAFDGPAYFINGNLSSFKVYDKKEEILKHFPKAEFFLIKNATHHVHLDTPKELTEIIVKILTKQSVSE